MIRTLRYALISAFLPWLALGQALGDGGTPGQSAGPGDLALAPSRLELPLKPGESKTVVVNVISSPGAPGAKPMRLLASLGDWAMTRNGQVTFSKPATLPRSATDWLIYSPVELLVTPGETHSIRVTVDVPEDATPGDYTSVLFVEERPPDLKQQATSKQIMFHFRLAAIIYVMVPPLTTKGSLTALDAQIAPTQITVQPVLRNEGNTRVRPTQSLDLLDAQGTVIHSATIGSNTPILANSELQPTLTLEKLPPPGEYSLRYRVDFHDGSKVIEGRKAITIPAPAPQKPAPAPKKKRGR